MSNGNIIIKGARVHNLKNIDVEIPKNRLTVLTGVSGSGKSSLAFDTIYAEGQRRYMESLSSYARQFMGSLEKPDVDYIEGLSPSLAIDQRTAGISPRSTVGTMSEIYDYLRLLFVRVGKVSCPSCGKELHKEAEIGKTAKKTRAKKVLEQIYACQECNLRIGSVNIGTFSFNNPQGACPGCRGLGKRLSADPTLVLPNPRLSLAEGAIRPWSRTTSQSPWYNKVLDNLAKKYHFGLNTPVGKLPKSIRQIVLYGDDEFEGVIPNLERRYQETDSDYLRTEIEKYMVEKLCTKCMGQRLRQEALAVKVFNKNIVEVTALSIEKELEFVRSLNKNLTDSDKEIVGQILKEIQKRLEFLIQVGVGYLTLSRSADTLSGGEAQRIRLASLLCSGLAGVIYILDEPSIGLHQRDEIKLIDILYHLRDLGNTVIVVEHDRSTIMAADYVVDLGPGSGELGGEIVSKGVPSEIKKSNTLTAQYLRGKRDVSIPKNRRQGSGKYLHIKGAKENNLDDIDFKVPLNTLTLVTGVSGSGKSTIVSDILSKALKKHFYGSKAEPGNHQSILGLQNINKVIDVDQSPIGKSPRSNPATFTNVFGPIREIYAATPEAQAKKFNSGHFSFNLIGGRCEACKGDGVNKFEMYFLPDVYVTCGVCGGKRYNKDVLEVYHKGKNIADVLDMPIEEAYDFFSDTPILKHKLGVMKSVGLGYMRLGQPATTLSGGEAQRVKLATELARQDTGKTFYILDEPTTGLHFEDIRKLLNLLQALVDKGNTVLVVEHNLDVIKCADWVIDLGPEGGEEGGRIVAQGTPEDVVKIKESYTGQYLKKLLNC